MAVIPYMLRCDVPDCVVVTAVTDTSDIEGWTTVDATITAADGYEGDDEPEVTFWLCPRCSQEGA